MRVQLLGTGSADGWPNPFCTCASCADARARGVVRGQTSALVDGTLLLDCGPEVPRAAERLRVDLTGVRTVLLTHAHPDHTGPAALLWWEWAGRGPLEVVGPAAALDACRPWVDPAGAVTFRVVSAGDLVELASGHEVLALPATHGHDGSGEALLYAVSSALLFLTDTGPLSDACLDLLGTGYQTVLLECTGLAQPDHLDVDGFVATVGRLRPHLADDARVVAVHLGHRNPPDLAERLAAVGAEVLPDGAVLGAPRKVLVTGGARSGKSRFAQSLLDGRGVDYAATSGSRGDDPEWLERVAAHRADRPSWWRTLETTDLVPLLASPGPALLVEDATLWLTAVLDEAGWTGSVAPALEELADAVRASPRDVVVVSNEVGAGVVPEHASGRRFRDDLGRLNQLLAAACDETWLVVAGRPLRL